MSRRRALAELDFEGMLALIVMGGAVLSVLTLLLGAYVVGHPVESTTALIVFACVWLYRRRCAVAARRRALAVAQEAADYADAVAALTPADKQWLARHGELAGVLHDHHEAPVVE